MGDGRGPELRVRSLMPGDHETPIDRCDADVPDIEIRVHPDLEAGLPGALAESNVFVDAQRIVGKPRLLELLEDAPADEEAARAQPLDRH